MANLVADLDKINRSKAAKEARDRRRENRQTGIEGASEIVRDSRRKQAWSISTVPDESQPMLPGMHPGASAIGIVHEALADFNMGGTLSLRYGGMDRKAGRGGHGIEEGTIYVEATLKPIAGMTSYFTVPVVVREAKMLFPGMLVTSNGIPRVLAQSTFDDLASVAKVDQVVVTDRHQFDGGTVKAGLKRDWSELRQAVHHTAAQADKVYAVTYLADLAPLGGGYVPGSGKAGEDTVVFAAAADAQRFLDSLPPESRNEKTKIVEREAPQIKPYVRPKKRHRFDMD